MDTQQSGVTIDAQVSPGYHGHITVTWLIFTISVVDQNMVHKMLLKSHQDMALLDDWESHIIVEWLSYDTQIIMGIAV